ncbi:hypothetical protein [Kibdelosporangium phytohabitans]|uniref:hypothetical protein n=1 Tax=Kibdelosporangium phytohabitans TaxID=860235 RepID=UPI0012F8CBC6|nr:hypothetical protein [Kibdelosporangium phytohabitans]MBE1464882.1 hypothetical protein [Kibdelosporangium phytohabitans]
MTKPVAAPDIRPVFGRTSVDLGLHRGFLRAFAAFYRDPVARLTLVITSLLLCYAGGAAMFYVHGIHFNEGGPAISPYLHWFIDSTVGFIGLTPAIAVLLPLTTRFVAGRPAWVFPVLLGGLFTVVTIPGPLVHDLFVARGTPLANLITHHFGDPSMVMPPPTPYSDLAKMTHQVIGGLPAYVLLSTVAYLLVRAIVGRWQRSS